MKNVKRIIALALALTFCLALTACGGKKDDNKLVMATNASFPPYEYVEGGNFAGIDVEIAQAIADKLGMELDIQDVDFGSIIAGVQTGKYDMGMAGMTVTDERLEQVNFTSTYATGIQSVIVKKKGDIKSIDDLKGAKIGVQESTTGDIYATDDYGADNVIEYKVGNDAVQALKTGKVDAVIIDNQPALSYVKDNKGLKILKTPYVEEKYAICIAKENEDLLKKVNDALEVLIKDGTVQKILDKYIVAE